MLLVLGLLSTEKVWELLLYCALVITAAIVCIVQNVSPWAYAEMMANALCLVVLWKRMPAWLLRFVFGARDDVHETRAQMEDLRVVFERQMVGEARRTQHALVAEVELGSLGQFTFTLVPALRDG